MNTSVLCEEEVAEKWPLAGWPVMLSTAITTTTELMIPSVLFFFFFPSFWSSHLRFCIALSLFLMH